MREIVTAQKTAQKNTTIALVGNPNVGKSTVFNALTGMRQHTGNWPGKTVSIATGQYTFKGKEYILVDLPGTYSLISRSEEERVASDFIRCGQADCTVVLVDATCLERTIVLALQVMELTDRMVVCVNLMDEAKRSGTEIDLAALERELGVPVIGTAAGSGAGLDQLQEAIREMSEGFLPVHPRRVLNDTEGLFENWNQSKSDSAVGLFSERASSIAKAAVKGEAPWQPNRWDRIALGKYSGNAVLLVLLFGVFWLTMKGANYPSALLEKWFQQLELLFRQFASGVPWWVSGLLIDGVYHTMSCVIAVMLPPLLIFFPLFSLLEDLGYLPRAAFLMDCSFEKCGSCGKQALTMAMGFGCNAAGVMGARIIASPRERLLAIVTNAFVPCNGRFPAMITLINIFFSDSDLAAAGVLTFLVLLSILSTLLATKFLSGTVLRKTSGQMILELPPYRHPNWKKICIQAFGDRTLFVLSRAIAVSAPAGAVIWLLQQLHVGGRPFLLAVAEYLNPIGLFLGMNGIILTAFLLSFPANELLLPSIIMLLSGSVSAGASDLGELLMAQGWTRRMALCTLLFLMFHWPCGTTCMTIRRETGTWKWTFVAVILPLCLGVVLCAVIARI